MRPVGASGKLFNDHPAAPFVKWAGGKGQLLRQFEGLIPPNFGRYMEPFVGGGALFFRLHDRGRIRKGAILSDLNPELMNCYRVLQNENAVSELIALLRYHQSHVLDPDYYYAIRFWDRAPDFTEGRTPLERAARTIFLNHTCYNGLFRLNRKGQFNAPYGKWGRAPRLFDEKNLWACHQALKGVALQEESFEACLDWARKGDFVYLDPPYVPLSSTANFTSYAKTPFTADDQMKVASVFRELDIRGCMVMLSNSDLPFVRKLFENADWSLMNVAARRNINCRGAKRGAIKEVVIVNYDVG